MWLDADSDEKGRGDEYDAAGDEDWDLGADRVYWRRRFLILGAGLVALGVCAWLIPGAHSPSRRAAAEARQSVAALNKRLALPAAAYGSAWASPSPTASPTPPAKLAAAATPATGRHPGLAANPAGARAGTSRCAPAGIVLSLFTTQASYARGARPEFSVYAVSTEAAACTLSFGAGAVQLIVTRNGHVLWDSAACRPASARPARFTLGVPQVLTLTWNPRATRPSGCGGSLAAGETGTFDAVAMSHGQSSPVRAFRIAGLPAEGGLERLAHVFHLDDLHRRPGRGTAARAGRDDRLAEAHPLRLGNPAWHAGHVAHLAGQADLAHHDDALGEGQVGHRARDGERYR
jgi:hypothetical protein